MISPRDIAAPFDRITWRDGQTLRAADLGAEQSEADRLWRLHIRYLHGVWGVVEGLGVVPDGPAALRVAPGYALDGLGATLLWPQAHVIAAPTGIVQTATLYLVISRPEETCECETGPRRFDCSEGRADRIEQGVLSWKTVGQVRPGADVLLARVLVAGGRIGAVDTSVQPRAASLNQPRLWSDATLAGQTGWADASRSGARFIEADIDASQAGYLATPVYSASISGAPQGATGFITAASARSFSFAVRLDSGPSAIEITAARAEQAGWTVAWFAVEVPAQRSPLSLWRLT
jgi:hypothetical protein